jgi:hypothetical protein|tara:strand:+ start:514 stop:1032 length:519 start_codon:yes stop_codon:yes gene_type:complete
MVSMVTKSVLSSEVIINCSTVKVWKIISSPNNLNHSHPFCKANTFQKWGKFGARDTIKYYNNLVLNRYFIEWREGKGYDLIIAKGNQNLAKVTWEILEKEKDVSKLKISLNIYAEIALKKYPFCILPFIKQIYFLPNMNKYLLSVVKGFKYYIETGNDVKKNQFDNNPMFSL